MMVCIALRFRSESLLGRPPSGAYLRSRHWLSAEGQCTDANAECRRIPPLLRQRISSSVAQRSGSQEIVNSAEFGGPDTIRTCGLRLRRATLYPAELRVHIAYAVLT